MTTKLLQWILVLIAGLASGANATDGVSKTSSSTSSQFAQQNPEFARLIQDIDGVYTDTQYLQGFFMACGGFGKPEFSCGLANDFYNQLAMSYNLPSQELEHPTKYLHEAEASRDLLEKILKLPCKKEVCVTEDLGFKKIKECVTVSYPGSLEHFLDKVPDFPGINKLKDKIRDAFKELKKEYESMEKSYLAQLHQVNDLINRLNLVQQAIDSEDDKVRRRAAELAAARLQDAIAPALAPLLKEVAKVSGTYVAKLNRSYLQGKLEEVLSEARSGTTSQQFVDAYHTTLNTVSEGIEKGEDPLAVMPWDVNAVMFHLLSNCVNRPNAVAAKDCIREQYGSEILTLSEDLIHSIYTHTSLRLLYEPCSAQLADDVTTEAAADTYGLSCAGYTTLQQIIQQLMIKAGNGTYKDSIAPFVKSVVEEQLRPNAMAIAREVVDPIPLQSFLFPGQDNSPIPVKTCDQAASRFALANNTCIVPLEKLYIYSWQEATLVCTAKFGASLCSKDQVAEGQQKGFSYCANSWTSTAAGPNQAYQVTPMSVNAAGCPPAGLNAAVAPTSKPLSGLCCVPIAK